MFIYIIVVIIIFENNFLVFFINGISNNKMPLM